MKFILAEKIEEKSALEKYNKSLTAELTQLEEHHSQLSISLKNQKNEQEELLMTQQTTEEKIKQILTFIRTVKNEEASKTVTLLPELVAEPKSTSE